MKAHAVCFRWTTRGAHYWQRTIRNVELKSFGQTENDTIWRLRYLGEEEGTRNGKYMDKQNIVFLLSN